MKLFKSTWLAGSMAAAMLALGAPAAVAGIAGSQHDFTLTGNDGIQGRAQNARTGATNVEICAFCHTPHAAETDAFLGAPLWNKNYLSGGATETNGAYDSTGSSSTRYSALGTASLDGAEVMVGSVSLACLSCHDGSQAMDVVFNMPGQGMGSGLGTGNLNNNYDPDNTIGKMVSDAGATGVTVINSVALLGTDLRNDHPISIEYAGGVSTGTSWTTTNSTTKVEFCKTSDNCYDPDFKPVDGISKNGTPVWFFDDVTVNSRVDKEEIRLYTRSSVDGQPAYVECGSCHDPHNTKDNYVPQGGANSNVTETAQGEAATQVDFLRQSNSESAICLTCHDK